MAHFEKTLDSQEIYNGRVIRVTVDKVELENGRTSTREVVHHHGGAGIVALNDKDEVYLVRQSRYALDKELIEIPAGKLDSPTEDPFVCAQRELSEETGLTAEHWQKLTCLETTPGFCNERIHLYLATGLHQGNSHPDEDEFVDVVRMPLAQAVEQVMNGTFRDGKTALALLMANQLCT